MAQFLSTQTKVEATAQIQLDEAELDILVAMQAWGLDAITKRVTDIMGSEFSPQRQAALRRFFETIKDRGPIILKNARDARVVLAREAGDQ